MLTKEEAQRIALCVNALRPDWGTSGLMTVLADPRCRNRVPRDLTLAFVALALDPETRRPGRIYEQGPWWDIARPAGKQAPAYKYVDMRDCSICGLSQQSHPLSQWDEHPFDPINERGAGTKPTDEQRAAIVAAKKAAEAARPAPKPKRTPRDPAEVIAEHLTEKEAS